MAFFGMMTSPAERAQMEQEELQTAAQGKARQQLSLLMLQGLDVKGMGIPGLQQGLAQETLGTGADGLLGTLQGMTPAARQAQTQANFDTYMANRQKIVEQAGRELDYRSALNAQNSLAATGFASPAEAIEFGQTVRPIKNALDAVDQMVWIRENLSAIGPADFIAYPEAAAAVDMFQQLESVGLFKNLMNDTRLSDEDRKFYSSIIELGFRDWLFAGGKVELAKLRMLQNRIAGTLSDFAIHPGAAAFPDLFERKELGMDIGKPYGGTPTVPSAEFGTGGGGAGMMSPWVNQIVEQIRGITR